MKDKIILDLCGGSGAWSQPYKEAGYKVTTITLPDYSVLDISFVDRYIHFRGKETIVVDMDEVVGVLAAPPCTMFSFARTNAKKPRDLQEGMKCVRACLDIIWSVMEIKQDTTKKTLPLKFWALENPYFGFLKNFLGKPAFIFDPWEFGDSYKKKTAIWGYFNQPIKTHNKMPNVSKFDKLKTKDIHGEFYGKYDRTTRRSITPKGFALSFFKANK